MYDGGVEKFLKIKIKMNSFLAIFSKLGIPAEFSQDVLLFLVVLLVAAVLAFFVGRFKLLAVLANAYIAIAIFSVVPEKYLEDYFYALIFIFGLIIFLTIFGKKLFDAYLSGWRVYVLSFLEAVFFASLILSAVPKKTALGYASSKAYHYLCDPTFHLFWIAAPLLFVLIIQKRINR